MADDNNQKTDNESPPAIRETPRYYRPKFEGLFNPYMKQTFISYKFPTEELECVKVFSNKTLSSSGIIYSTTKKSNVYVYEVLGTTAGFFVNGNFPFSDTDPSYLSFAYFDMQVDSVNLNDDNNNYKLEYYCHNLGKMTNEEMKVAMTKNWFFIPREVVKGVNSKVYLFVCCKSKPSLHAYYLPYCVPILLEPPVATSINSGMRLKDSRIILGKIVYLTMWDELLYLNFTCEWCNGNKTLTTTNNCCCYNEQAIIHTNRFFITPKVVKTQSFSVSLDVMVYNKTTSDIKAFVWQSGSDDDRVNKASPSTTGIEARNKYPHVLESLSLNTIYGSYISLSQISPCTAANYVARHLACQPPGMRSFSVEGYLGVLMGGALVRIADILRMYNKAKDSKDEAKKAAAARYLPWIPALFCYNDSFLFFDKPVNYLGKPKWDSSILIKRSDAKAEQEAKFFLRNVLRILQGTSGCTRLKHIMTTMCISLRKLITVDYVYCDIEKIWNDAQMLSANRFNVTCLNYLSGNNIDLNYVVNENARNYVFKTILWNEILRSSSLLNHLKSRNFNSANQLDAVMHPNDDGNLPTATYGIAGGSWTKNERVSLNTWDAVMKTYENSLFYEFLFKPLNRYLTTPTFSAIARTEARGFIHQADRFETHLGGDVLLEGFTSMSGIRSAFASCCCLYDNYVSKKHKQLSMYNWKMMPPATLSSFFVDHINRLKALSLTNEKNQFNVFITSWNIWAYDLNKELPEQERSSQIALKAYHKELLYHTFLSCPNLAIAYFNTEDQRHNESGYISLGNNYYNDSYAYLNETIADIKNACGGQKFTDSVRIVNNQLTSTSDPIVVSGVQLNNGNFLWRITFLSAVSVTGDTIRTDGKTLKIQGSYTDNNTGLWVVNSNGKTSPVTIVSDNNYYYTHPAFVANRFDDTALFARSASNLRFIGYKFHTLFGELPRNHTMSMTFMVKKAFTDTRSLLFASVFGNYHPQLSSFSGSKPTLQIGSQSQLLSLNKQYELKFHLFDVDKNRAQSKITATGDYELWESGKIIKRVSKLFLEYKNTKNIETLMNVQYLTDEITLVSGKVDDSELEVTDFRIYFSGHHEKLELFRKSDGVKVAPDAVSPPFVSRNDIIMAKFSWLNAENKAMEYSIKGIMKLDLNNKYSSVSLVPIPCKDLQYSLSNTGMDIQVNANSEGYFLFECRNLSNANELIISMAVDGKQTTIPLNLTC